MANFTLIDVENGMFNLSLHTILTPPCFTFFWGLIQTANRLKPRFKNPFNLTVAQAIAAGGGNSRQSIHQKQSQLNKIRVDGARLIKIRAGSRSKYVCARYQINYNLLIPQNVIMPEFTVDKSKIIDTPLDTVLTHPLTQSGHSHDLPKIRGDQKREEKNPPTISNIVSNIASGMDMNSEGGDGSKSEKETTRSKSKEVEDLQALIIAAFHPQITSEPPYAACRSAIDKYGYGILKAAADELNGKALDKPTPQAALNYVMGCAKRLKSPGIDYTKRNEIIMSIQDMRAELLAGEADTDLSKFVGLSVPSGSGPAIVEDKEQWIVAMQNEINRRSAMIGDTT